MGIPYKLKNMNLFLDGTSHLGVVSETTLPKLTVKMEEWRGGGMLGPLMIDQGLDKLEAEFTLGGLADSPIRQFGAVQHDAVLLRFAGAYQEDGTGQVRALEATVRGRYSEIDLGNGKPGSDTENKGKLAGSYYRLDVDGQNWLEIDLLAATFIVFGQDRYAEIRAAIGG
jgi:P2 family phage contractile tail tube protein